jgi:hypothetical protein
MGERGQTYDDVVATVTGHFEEAVGVAERLVGKAGGRFLAKGALDTCMAESIKRVLSETSDVALLSVVASRPWLLHAEPGLYGQFPTPREGLERSLGASVAKDLAETKLARLGEGQDQDTLPAMAEASLAALAEIEAGGRRFRDAGDARRVLSAGDWESDLVYGIGMPLADFLGANGREGVGNDLRAAIEAREVVLGRTAGPAPR